MTDEPTTNNPTEDETRLISLAEAAEMYGFNRDYLSQLARRGRLKAVRIARNWLTTPADVEAYIASRQRRGAYRNDIGTVRVKSNDNVTDDSDDAVNESNNQTSQPVFVALYDQFYADKGGLDRMRGFALGGQGTDLYLPGGGGRQR